MKTKTFKIEKLVKEINRRNRESSCEPNVRKGWNSILETILHETGNYSGFNYYSQNQVSESFKPGIRTNVPHEERFNDTDETRIYFFLV